MPACLTQEPTEQIQCEQRERTRPINSVCVDLARGCGATLWSPIPIPLYSRNVNATSVRCLPTRDNSHQAIFIGPILSMKLLVHWVMLFVSCHSLEFPCFISESSIKMRWDPKKVRLKPWTFHFMCVDSVLYSWKMWRHIDIERLNQW